MLPVCDLKFVSDPLSRTSVLQVTDDALDDLVGQVFSDLLHGSRELPHRNEGFVF